MLRNINIGYLLIVAIACSAPRQGGNNCLTQFQSASPQSAAIDLRKSSYNGGFLVEHLINTDDQKLAAAAGDYSGTFDERLSTGHFFVTKTESGYKIKAFSRPNHPQFSTSAAVDIMIFYNGGYVQVPTKSADMARFRKIVKDSGLMHEQSMESEEYAAYDMLLRYLSPQPDGDYFALPCPEGVECQKYPILEIYDLEVPLNLLNLMVYERYNKEINDQTEVEDIDGRNRLIAQYKSQILAALDHAVSLSNLPPDADMQAWYDLQQRFKAIGFKQSYRSYWINKMGCEKKPDRSPLCKPEWANKLKDLLSNGLLTVDNGQCEQVPVIAFMEQIKSSSSHSLKSCGGIDLGELAFESVSYGEDYKIFDAYIEAESKKTADTLHALYRKILAKGLPIYAATNFVYEPTHDADGKRVEFHKKVFYYEFDVAKPARYSVIDGDGTYGPIDFLENLKYHGPGNGSALLVENTSTYYEQFYIHSQLGSLFTVGGWPFHIIDVSGPEDTGGQIIPPPPLPDLEDASRAAAPAAAPQASADPAPNPTSATPNNVTPPAQTQPDPTPIAGGPTTPAPVVDPVLTPDPVPPATQPIPSPTPSPTGPTAPVLVDEPIATPPSADPAATPGDAVASQAPATDNSATNPNAAPGPAPIIIGQATSEPGSIGGLGSRGDQLDPAAQSDFGCD